MATRKKAKEERELPVLSTDNNRKAMAQEYMESFNRSRKGRAQIKVASEYSLPYMTKRLPTGLLSLDLELRGGFPAGGLSQIAGPKNSGKTYMTWQAVRQLQAMLGDKMMVLLAMTEMRADRLQARQSGVHIALSDVDIASFNSARAQNGVPLFTPEEVASLKYEVGTFHELHGESAEDLYDGILGAVEKNLYHLIIIDSFGSIMSGAEAESESLKEKQYGGSAGVNSKFLRKLGALLTIDDPQGMARDVVILGINQIRANIGGDAWKEFRSPGGHMLEHAKFVDLFVMSGSPETTSEKEYTINGTKDRTTQLGKDVNWKIEKGKAGIHEGGRGAYYYSFETNSADFFLDTTVVGVQRNIIEKAGSWLGLRDPDHPENYLLREQSQEKFVTALYNDAIQKAAAGDSNTFMNLIRSLAFEQEKIYINYDWT